MRGMPDVGDKAPEFELENQDGEKVRLADFKGRNVVLYFYPQADTPGCTKQACGIRDRATEYEQANAVVVGVSPDTVEDLRAFADKYGLAFTLLADADHQVAERYGVWVEKHRDGRTWWGNRRSTALIDPEGNIARVFEDVDPAGHDELMLGALRKAAASA